jgi:hypothetical protein
MLRSIFVVAAAGPMLAATACAASNAQSGPVESRTFAVSDFTGIELAGPYEVKVRTGQAVGVHAKGPRDGLDSMQVEVREGRLVIRGKNGWSQKGWEKAVRVQVTVPALRSAAVTGSGDLSVDRVSGESFKGALAGSGDLKLSVAEVRTLELRSASSGDVAVGQARVEQLSGSLAGSGDLSLGQVAAGEVKLSTVGSGDVRAAGQARTASYSVAGSGDLDAAGLTTASASASVAGSGNIRAHVTGEASASVIGSGNIDIKGGASCRQSVRGSGDIRCS